MSSAVTPKPTRAEIDAALGAVSDVVRGERDYGAFIVHFNRYRSDALRVAGHYRGGAILEIGSSPYHLTLLLQKLGYPVIGIDLAPERSAHRIRREGLDVRRCDIENEPLPFPSGAVDLVVFNEVLEHLRVDPLFTLSEINRVMRPGGILLLTTPNLYAIQSIAKLSLGRGLNDPITEFLKLRDVGHMGHIREYSAREVRLFLGYADFLIQQLSFDHYYYPRSKRGLAARLLFTLLPRRFRTFQIVVARKVGPGPGLSPLAIRNQGLPSSQGQGLQMPR